MQRFICTSIFALSFAVTLAGASLAEPPGDSHRDGHHSRDHAPEKFIEEHADELGLSEQTREEIEKISAHSRQRAQDLRAAASGDRKAMHELLQQPIPNEAEVMALAEKINDDRLEEKKNRLEALLSIRKLLTEEQRAKLVQLRRGKFQGRRPGSPIRGCRQDIARVCPDAEPGRSMLQCMSTNWDKLSDECQSSVDGRAAEDHPRRERRAEPPVD